MVSFPESDADVLDRALAWVDEGRRVAIATVVETWGSSPRPRGSQLVVRDDGLFFGSVSGGCVEGKVVEAAGGRVFVQAFNPPLRLVIVGAVHIAEPLARMGALLGYAVVMIDPREGFARPERWPGLTVATDWPDEVLATLAVDHRTAIVALTHDPKIDDAALESALRSDAFDIGALGRQKTHAARALRLAEQGFTPAQIARIHGPIGLRIGARSPAEIAVSVVAQLTERLRNGAAKPE